MAMLGIKLNTHALMQQMLLASVHLIINMLLHLGIRVQLMVTEQL